MTRNESSHYIESVLVKAAKGIWAQAEMITMDASTGTTAEVAVARIRAIREYATQAERVLTELSPSTPIFLQNISEV